MKYYKIMKQNNICDTSFKKMLKQSNISYITGKYGSSIAIEYSPEQFRNFLNDDKFFSVMRTNQITQLIVTNEMYIELFRHSKNLEINMSSYDTDNDEKITNYCDETNEDSSNMNSEFYKLLEKENIIIKEVRYKTFINKRSVTIQSNGVLGIDSEIEKNESQFSKLKLLIDTLNYGLRVLNNE